MRARFTSAVAIRFAYQIISEWNKSDSMQNEKIWRKMINSDAFGREKRVDLREKDIEFINKVENRCFSLTKAAVIWENSQGYWVRKLHFKARSIESECYFKYRCQHWHRKMKSFFSTGNRNRIGKSESSWRCCKNQTFLVRRMIYILESNKLTNRNW